MNDVLDARRLRGPGGTAEPRGRKHVAHRHEPRRVDRLARKRTQPRRYPRLVTATEGDDIGVETYLSVLEMTDAHVGHEDRGVGGIGVARADVVVIGNTGPWKGTHRVGDLKETALLQQARARGCHRATRSLHRYFDFDGARRRSPPEL